MSEVRSMQISPKHQYTYTLQRYNATSRVTFNTHHQNHGTRATAHRPPHLQYHTKSNEPLQAIEAAHDADASPPPVAAAAAIIQPSSQLAAINHEPLQ
jgi:hypothetical protein